MSASARTSPRTARSVIDFPHTRGAHCGSSSARDLLEFYGLGWGSEPESEAMAFGLSGGLDVLYDASSPFQLPFYVGGRSAVMELDFCRHVGAEVEFRRTDDAGAAWDWLRTELDEGRPTMLWADMHELSYLDVVFHHTHHTVVVTGYDLGERVAYVADYDFDDIQPCTLESLARARRSHAFPEPCNHTTFVARFPDRLPPPRAAIVAAIGTEVGNMRSGRIAMPEGLDPDDVPEAGAFATGLRGLDLLASEYGAWPDRFGDGLGMALKGLRFYILRAGTGGALFRSLQASFLEEAAELLGDESLRPVAAHYELLASLWVELAHTVKASDARVSHAAGAAVLDRLGRAERDGVDLLEEWVARADGAVR